VLQQQKAQDLESQDRNKEGANPDQSEASFNPILLWLVNSIIQDFQTQGCHRRTGEESAAVAKEIDLKTC